MNFNFRKTVIVFLVTSAFHASVLTADDTLHFSNGTVTGGVVLGDNPKATIVGLRLENGIKVALPKSDVRVVKATDAANQYVKEAGSGEDDVNTHNATIALLNKNGLGGLATAHTQRLVELDPSNASAWRVLKYQNTEGGWIPIDRYWKGKGMMRDGMRWRTPQDLALSTILEQRKRAASEMKGKIEKSLRDYDLEGRRGDEARSFFASLKDATALPILSSKILDDETSENTALMLLDIMLRLNAQSLDVAVVKILVNHDSFKVRDRCMEYLQDHPSEVAIQQLLHYLTNDDPAKDSPETYNRVGAALELIGDDRCISPLVNVLVTKHFKEVGPNGNTNVGFNSSGVTNFSPNSQKKLIERHSNNAGILGALNAISGADLGYDKAKWNDWYAAHFADTNLELRRDR